MLMRPLLSLCALALLSACSSTAPVSAPLPSHAPAASPAAPLSTPLPADLRELRGQLLGAPLAAEVEVALLLVDRHDRPLQMLASALLQGDGNALPFSLRFTPSALAPGMRAELRARVSQAGVLTQHLPAKQFDPSSSADVGQLRLVSAP